MKRVFPIIAALLLLMVQGAWAQDATVIDGVYYLLNNEDQTAKVVEPNQGKYQGDIVVPDYVKYDGTDYAVTILGEGAFMQATQASMQTTAITHPSKWPRCLKVRRVARYGVR